MNKKRRRNNKKYWRYVFRKVISRYEEVKETRGTVSAPNIYDAVGNYSPGSLTFNPRVVRVNSSDFIADVELAAKRALENSPAELALFRAVYINGQQPSPSEEQSPFFQELKHSAQEKIGRYLRMAKIFPLSRYFLPTYN